MTAPAVAHRLAAAADRHTRCRGIVGNLSSHWGYRCQCVLWAGHPPPCRCQHQRVTVREDR